MFYLRFKCRDINFRELLQESSLSAKSKLDLLTLTSNFLNINELDQSWIIKFDFTSDESRILKTDTTSDILVGFLNLIGDLVHGGGVIKYINF